MTKLERLNWVISHVDRNTTVARADKTIYISAVRKLDREFARTHSELTFDPWADTRQLKALRGRPGAHLLAAVIKSTLELRGFGVRVRIVENSRHGRLWLEFSDYDIPPLVVTSELPVLAEPVWHPRRYGRGCWSFLELHLDDCWFKIHQTLSEINAHIRNHLHPRHASTVYCSSVGPINPTHHVMQMVKQL